MGWKYEVMSWEPFYQGWEPFYQGDSFFKAFYFIFKLKLNNVPCIKLEWR